MRRGSRYLNTQIRRKMAEDVLRRNRGRRRRAAAFTLVELLIAATLMTLLLAALWTMLFQARGLSDRGREEVQQQQLLRSLAQLWSDDLTAAAELPAVYLEPPTATLSIPTVASPNTATEAIINTASVVTQIESAARWSSSSESMTTVLPGSLAAPIVGEPQRLIIRRVSLDAAWRPSPSHFLESSLVMDFQGLPPGPPATSRSLFDSSNPGSGNAQPLACLREIEYLFVDSSLASFDAPVSSRKSQGGDPSGLGGEVGLVRIDRPWLQGPTSLSSHGSPVSSSSDSSMERSSIVSSSLGQPPPVHSASDFDAMRRPQTQDELDSGSLGELREAAPEVTRLAFRYFDGRQWNDQWTRVELPTAIEVSFDLEPTTQETDKPRETVGPPATLADPVPAARFNPAEPTTTSSLWAPQFRLVFRVGAAGLRSTDLSPASSTSGYGQP